MSQRTKTIIISIVVCVVLAGVGVGLYCAWPAIVGTITGNAYYTYEDVQNAYNDGYTDGIRNEEELTAQIDYYKGEVDKYAISLGEAQSKIENLEKDLQDAINSGNADKETIAGLQEDLAEAQADITAKQEQIEELQDDIKYYQELLEAYADSDKLRVTFTMVDNGKERNYDVQVVEPNGYLSEVITPDRADFEGWSLTKGGELIDDLTTVQVTDNMTIYGMCTNTVTFMVNGEEYATQEVSYGKYATDIEVSLAGYTFEGWSLTEGGEIITFNTIPIMKDIIFYACIEKRLYSISEYSEGNQIGILDYYIFNANDLIYLSNSENAFNGINLYLANDIDMSNIQFKTINNFNGNFNGQNHTIYNLNTSLFNYLGSNFENRIEVCNLILKNSNLSYVANSNYYGVLANMLSNVDLYNCHNISSYTASYTGDVSGGIGGLFGSVAHCDIEKCSNSMNIESDVFAGGLIGQFLSGTINNSYNIGSVSGNSAGGLFGTVLSNGGSDVIVKNCYNAGNVTGSTVGGIASWINDGNLSMTNCFNVGIMTKTGNLPVGSVGGVIYEANLTLNYFISLSNDSYIGSFQSDIYSIIDNSCSVNINLATDAKNLDFYTNSSNWNISLLWDFENVWKINSDVNKGYPYLI